MTISRHIALRAYYYGTWPYRRWAFKQAAARGQIPISILFYHRVADYSPNDWTISNERFKRQVRWLQRNFDLISLEEAQRRLRERASARPAVCLTFDDGYADNCTHALPLLADAGIPCTYFVSSRFVQDQRPFPHDVIRNQPLAPNTIDQLRGLVRAGIEIGAHTRTHLNLASVTDPSQLRDEIVAPRSELEAWLDCTVRYFAFPYGQLQDISQLAMRVARDAGYQGVCSAYGGYNMPTADPFHLRRIHGDPLMIRIKNWLTIDPRQPAIVRRLEQKFTWSDPTSQVDGTPS